MPSSVPKWQASLYDLPQFRGLEQVGEAFGVRFSLRGGTASRLAMALALRPEAKLPMLVELAPFASDVNLFHNGPDHLSPHIHEAILEIVPEAPWCRWSIQSWDDWYDSDDRDTFQFGVALRRLRIDSWRLAPVDERAAQDLETSAVSFVGSPTSITRAGGSVLGRARARGDGHTDIIQVLRAYNAAAELSSLTRSTVTLDLEVANQVIDAVLPRQFRYELGELGEKERASALMTSLLARNPRTAGGLDRLTDALARAEVRVLEPAGAVAAIVSRRLTSGQSRLPLAVRFGAGAARTMLDATLEASAVEIDPAFELGRASQVLKVEPGVPVSFEPWGRPRQEFVALAWRERSSLFEQIGAVVFDQAKSARTPFTVGGAFADTRWLRFDISEISDADAIQIAVLQGGAKEGSDPEPEPLPRIGGPGERLDDRDLYEIEASDANQAVLKSEGLIADESSNSLATSRWLVPPRRALKLGFEEE